MQFGGHPAVRGVDAEGQSGVGFEKSRATRRGKSAVEPVSLRSIERKRALSASSSPPQGTIL